MSRKITTSLYLTTDTKRGTAIFTEGHGKHVAAEQVDDVLVEVVREYRERGGHSVRQGFKQVMLQEWNQAAQNLQHVLPDL